MNYTVFLYIAAYDYQVIFVLPSEGPKYQLQMNRCSSDFSWGISLRFVTMIFVHYSYSQRKKQIPKLDSHHFWSLECWNYRPFYWLHLRWGTWTTPKQVANFRNFRGTMVKKPLGKLPNLRIPIRSFGKIPMMDAKGLDLFFLWIFTDCTMGFITIRENQLELFPSIQQANLSDTRVRFRIFCHPKSRLQWSPEEWSEP